MRDLIVFGEDFGALPSSTQHLITQLCHNRSVLWVNSIGLRKPKLCRHDIERLFAKLFAKVKRYHSIPTTPASLTVVNIRTLPAPKYRWERALAKSLIQCQLLPVIRQLNLRQPLLWSSLPTAADLCGSLGEHAVVYYCGDDFSALAGVDHQTVAMHEQKLAAKADLILVATEALQARFASHKTA